MESLKCIATGILLAIIFTVGVYYAIDREVARQQYNDNIKQCKLIDGCLFEHNCNKYNKMIEEECK